MKKLLFLFLCVAFGGCNSDVSVEQNVYINENANTVSQDVSKRYVTNFALPHLNSSNYYVEHTVMYDNQLLLNYAFEKKKKKKHAAWVAFVFDNITSQNNIKRTDAWNVDPKLPTDMQTTEEEHKSDGFDKGHLCASYDRVFSKEANEQTFYYSNMSPQINSFNSGFWASFEGLVQKWARSNSYDKLYVTKGGTLDALLINYKDSKGKQWTDVNGFTKKGLACPKFYYMAILSEKNAEYHAIGFWIEHRDDYGYGYDKFAPSSVMKKYAVNIDELEEKTGLDFFCNLPDVIEEEVESTYNENDWAW